MSRNDHDFRSMYALVSGVVMALAFIGLPWAWVFDPTDPTDPVDALALVIRAASAVIVLCVIVVALQWASKFKEGA